MNVYLEVDLDDLELLLDLILPDLADLADLILKREKLYFTIVAKNNILASYKTSHSISFNY